MEQSVRTKAQKKQSSLLAQAPIPVSDREFEHSLRYLENACISVLDGQFSDNRGQDEDGLYWQQRFLNIATPISLALREYKGPRRFHYHYRHRAEDDSVLEPVLANPIDMLALACRDALSQCKTLVGIQDRDMAETARMLENALRGFLQHYREYRIKLKK